MATFVTVSGEQFRLESYDYREDAYLSLKIPAVEDYATVKRAFKENTGDISVFEDGELVKTFSDFNSLTQILDDMEYYYVDIEVSYDDGEALKILATARINVPKARRLRKSLESVASDLPDEKAIDEAWMFPLWAVGVAYKINDRVQYEDLLYRCVQAHTSQADWTPDKVPALFVNVADPTIEWPDWKQPAGAHDAYNKGDKVAHNEKHWTSDIDGNVWEPGVYGWTEA